MGERKPNRTLDEWMQLVTECRASGLTDLKWCEIHGISIYTFYNACTRLKRNACVIPKKQKNNSFDLTDTPVKQDVVKVELVDEVPEQLPVPIPEKNITPPAAISEPLYLDNHHTIEIELNGAHIRVTNDVNPALLSKAISSLRSMTC